MKRLLVLFLTVLLAIISARAQYYDTQDPASLKWRQIRTAHFLVIFPEDFAGNAEKYALLLEQSYNRLYRMYPSGKTDIPVIIHSHSMQSNGFVTWAPHRMELFPFPGQDNLPMSPARQLTTHETTHVLQLSSLNRKGMGKIMSILLGEQAMGFAALEIPMWAFEGDAVYAETATSLSGRGRSNAFTRDARALLCSENSIYGYDKMISGSYKDFTPDHYVFGYLMMNQLHGADSCAWQSILENFTSVYFGNPVNRILKKRMDLTKKKLYDSTFAGLEKPWEETDQYKYSEYTALNPVSKKDYMSYNTPYRRSDGTIISLRTSLSAPSAFVITENDTVTEHVLTTTGYIYPGFFSYADSTLVWCEMIADPRWDNRDYSVIMKMNSYGGPVTQLTRRTRYTAPDLSPDGKIIVAVSTTPDLHYSLVFLNAKNGGLLAEVNSPDNLILQRPAWSSDGKAVTVITLCDKGEGIRTYLRSDNKWTVNIDESPTDIVQGKFSDDALYFLAQGDGSDNIYRLTDDTVITRVTASRFGISGFSVQGDEILFSECTAKGYMIARDNIHTDAGPAGKGMYSIIPPVAPMTGTSDEPEQSLSTDFVSEPYKKISHLFNFHSWFPFYCDIDEIQTDMTAVNPGITLLSQNQLSTLITTAGYEYSNGNHYLHSGIKWKGWHPVLEADIRYGGDPVITKDTITRPDPANLSRDMIINTSIYDQLWFAGGKFRQLFMPAIYLSYRNRYTYISETNSYNHGSVIITGRLYFSNTFRTAYRDIYPRWGQVIDIRYTTAPWDKDMYGQKKYIAGTFYFPGFYRNHSIKLKAGYEDQGPFSYMLYYNSLSMPRGYDEPVIMESLFSFSADYTMPLFYPDFSAGSFFYLKRIRGSAFFDRSTGRNIYNYETGSYNENIKDYNSFGGELLADFYLLRFPFEISAGVSTGFIPAMDKTFINGTLSVNIYGTVLGRER